jgi:phosphoribosylaminoimidazole-succinocarboxamide synthase
MSALHTSAISNLDLIHRGKVRDIYRVDDDHMLIVASDRLSAFDVVLPQPIPGKGEVLTRVANFWFGRTKDIVPNHLSGIAVADVVTDPTELTSLGERATVVRRLKALPVEAIVRGYLIGSGWKDYQTSGAVCGINLPAGLRQADRLPEAIYTPSTKAAVGDHDENVDFEHTVGLLGRDLAEQVRDTSLRIYGECAAYALTRGIIIADTKFEFGLDADGRLHLIDEVLTPDSSRFWPLDQYQPGTSPPSFDKQFVRDYLETLDWDKTPPGPELPQEIIDKTAEKYREAEQRLTGTA